MVGEGLFPDGADYDPDPERAWCNPPLAYQIYFVDPIDLPGTDHLV